MPFWRYGQRGPPLMNQELDMTVERAGSSARTRRKRAMLQSSGRQGQVQGAVVTLGDRPRVPGTSGLKSHHLATALKNVQ